MSTNIAVDVTARNRSMLTIFKNSKIVHAEPSESSIQYCKNSIRMYKLSHVAPVTDVFAKIISQTNRDYYFELVKN